MQEAPRRRELRRHVVILLSAFYVSFFFCFFRFFILLRRRRALFPSPGDDIVITRCNIVRVQCTHLKSPTKGDIRSSQSTRLAVTDNATKRGGPSTRPRIVVDTRNTICRAFCIFVYRSPSFSPNLVKVFASYAMTTPSFVARERLLRVRTACGLIQTHRVRAYWVYISRNYTPRSDF